MMDIACSSTRNCHYTMVPSQAILLLWLPVFLVRPDFQSVLCLVKVTVSHQAIYERDRPKGTLHSLRGQVGTMWVFYIQGCLKLSQMAYLHNLKFAKNLIFNACNLPQVQYLRSYLLCITSSTFHDLGA